MALPPRPKSTGRERLPDAVALRLADLSARAIWHVRLLARQGVLPGFAGTLGLPAEGLAELHAATGLACLQPAPPDGSGLVPPLPGFPYPHLLAWMWRHRRQDAPLTHAVAAAVACATFGSRHLWQDLGFDGRDDVRSLLEGHFPALVERNVHDLKWKRFLYQEVGTVLGHADLRPPRCGACDQYAACYGTGL